MRIKVLAFAVSFLLVSTCWAGPSQTPVTSSTQATTILSQSVTALNGPMPVNDVTLAGTVEWIAGSDDETGTVTYKGVKGAYRLDMTFRNGTRSEIVSPVNGLPAGNWIGLDGTSHPIANHNLMVDAGWFPTFTLGSLAASSNTVLSYVGQETRNGIPVTHISFFQAYPGLSGDDASQIQHLTQVDFYFDPSTLLPVSYVYNSHPDNNFLRDIPTEIRYSNYRTFGGSQVPLRIQKLINGTLFIDLQFQAVSFNSGLNASQISPL